MPRLSKFEKGLNPAQLDAVRHIKGPLLVLAGAGSGKTSVVTRRIGRLITKEYAKANEILAVTFTNKAAGEMRERVASLVGKRKAEAVTISTFHSFCLKVLREHIEHLGFRRNFTISGEGDTRTIIRRIVEDMDGVDESFNQGTLREQISLAKGSNTETFTLTVPSDESKEEKVTREKYETWLPEVYEQYQSALRAANTLDFDDLLTYVLKLFAEHPRILSAYQKRYKFVMVDEYQDTNPTQYQLVQLLVAKHKNLCVVGDDDQSIYGWRGADVRNILQFEKDFPKAKIVTLAQNYRSVESVLHAANSIIKNNAKRREKTLFSALGPGQPLDWILTADDEHEAKITADWIAELRSSTGADFKDIAILYRSNTQSRPYEIAFRTLGIPYNVVGGQDLFERAEVRDIISYLKALANPWDEAAFLRIVNMPRRGIGDKSLHAVHDLCRARNVSLGKGMATALREGVIHGSAEKGMRSFLGLMSETRRKFKERKKPMSEILEELVEHIGYKNELERTSKSLELARMRWENIEAVVKALDEFESSTKGATLGMFLDQSSLNSDLDKSNDDDPRNNAVTLMTIHSAKGLEFPYVFIAGVEEGLLPHDKSMREGAVDEERRLFYVALTRAQKHCILLETCARRKHGRDRICTTSRFMKEIPDELLNKHVRAARDMVVDRIDMPKPNPKKRKRSKVR
jgi:superfamily I DNA/RNA helicase